MKMKQMSYLGFLYYIRYFTVIPDELFQQNLQKAATTAFLIEVVALVPLLFGCFLFYPLERALPVAFALSFAVAVIVFSILLTVLEWREQEGAKND